MKRISIMMAVLIAALSIGGARAYFTAKAEVKDSIITAGTVAVAVEPTEAALSIAPLAPGEAVVRAVDITNTGTLPLDAVTTVAKKAGYTDLWAALECTVTAGGQTLYAGPLSSMRTRPVRVGPGRVERVSYAVSLPPTAGDELQGDYVRASLYVDAEQAH